jgi:sugar-specific transcriptional regulator TrmB
METYTDIRRRGCRIRLITDISKANVSYCKELAKYVELRHFDGIKGNLGIVDGISYGASARSQEGKFPTEYIYSTVKSFVEQQQYFFDMLWNKAIPAKQRIKEIEEGLKREFIETIQDPVEIQRLIPKVINSAAEELDVVFSTANSFYRYKKEGVIELLTHKADNAVNVRILIKDDDDDDNIEDNVKDLISKHPINLKIQYLNSSRAKR